MSGCGQREHTKEHRSVPSGYLSIGRDILSLIGAGVGVTYALGFIIVNLHLFSFGIYEPGLLRIRYLGAGILFLVIGGTAAIPIGQEVRRVVTQPSQPILREDLRLHGKALVECAFLAVLIIDAIGIPALMLRSAYPRLSEWITRLVLSSVKWSVVALLPSGALVIARARQWRTKRELSPWDIWSGIFLGLLILVIYAIGVYPILPPSVGGGAPVKVHILLDPLYANDYERLGIPLQDANLTGRLCLMDQTDRGYIVHVHEHERDTCIEESIEIDRRATLAVLYSPGEAR